MPQDHPSKYQEIGSEKNPAEFIDMLLGLTAEWGRVLAPHGSIAIELGDTYSGSGGAGGDYTEGGLREGQNRFDGSAARANPGRAGGVRYQGEGHARSISARPSQDRLAKNTPGWPRAKSLALIPQLYAVALAYGINPLTGQPSPAGRWLVRNVIVWHRPNPAVGALGDKVRPSTSYIVIATRSAKRWFDLTAVRTAFSPNTNQSAIPDTDGAAARAAQGGRPRIGPQINTHAGAPPLDAWFDEYDYHDTWTLTTQPSRISMPVVERVPCGPDDGGERTTSPDCPVHGDQADLPPTAPGDEPLGDQSLRHISHTDARRGPEPSAPGADDASTRSDSGSLATRCDNRSSRTVPAPSTNQPDMPSAQTSPDTSRTPESPELFGDRPDTSASSSAEACPLVGGHETALRSDHTSDLESACTCTFHLEKHSIHSHYAMWPAKLAERLVLMMCPRDVCRKCGEPRRRVEGAATYAKDNGRAVDAVVWGGGDDSRLRRLDTPKDDGGHITRLAPTLGWTDCGHDNYRPGHVLDPFAGSGTTCAVADLHGRDATGIDFDQRNHDIYPARYAEVKRALFNTPIADPAQMELAL